MPRRPKLPAYLPIGPILDSKDLKEKEVVAALIAAARMVEQPAHVLKELHDHQEWLDKDYDQLDDLQRTEQAPRVIADLEDILINATPAYCTFSGPNGAHRSWGVWPDGDSLFVAESEGDLERTGSRIDIPERRKRGMEIPEYNLVVSDHGNMTLYHRAKTGRGYRWKEVWSVV